MSEAPGSANPRLRITRRSGKVRVVAVPGAALAVEGGRWTLGDDGVVDVRASGGSTLEVRCAAGTDLTVGTSSGGIEIEGDAGSVRVTTASGAVSIERATAVDARGTSGRVEVGSCTGSCVVVSVSSDVRIRAAGRAVVATVSGDVDVEAAGDAEVKTVSGRVVLGARGGGRLVVRSISGAIEVSVPAGAKPATRLRSMSGRVHRECEPGDEGEIRASSMSGTITVSCR